MMMAPRTAPDCRWCSSRTCSAGPRSRTTARCHPTIDPLIKPGRSPRRPRRDKLEQANNELSVAQLAIEEILQHG